VVVFGALRTLDGMLAGRASDRYHCLCRSLLSSPDGQL